ncbi:MAG: Uncharacterized amino acid permease, GabP family, partial [uncultured Gemmatimonadetes bacterium]
GHPGSPRRGAAGQRPRAGYGPAAAAARAVERGGGAGGLHHRQRDLSRAQHHRGPGRHGGGDGDAVDRGGDDRPLRRPDAGGARGALPALGRDLRVPARGVRPAPRLSLRVDGAAGDPPLRAGRHRHALRGVPAHLCAAGRRPGARGRHGGHPHPRHGQHRLAALRGAGAERVHRRQGPDAGGARRDGVRAGRLRRRELRATRPVVAHHLGRLRDRAGGGDVGVRRVGGPHLHGRRGPRPGPHPPARAAGRDGRGGDHLPGGERRVPVRPPLRRDAGQAPGGRGRSALHLRAGGGLRGGGHGDALGLRGAERLHDDGPPHLLRDGGGRALLPPHRRGAPALPHAVRGDRPGGRAGDRLRLVPLVRAAGRRVHPGHLALLRGGGARRLHVAPEAAGAGAPVPHLGLPVRTHRLPDRLRRHAPERGLPRDGADAVRLCNHPAGDSRVLRLAGDQETRLTRRRGRTEKRSL